VTAWRWWACLLTVLCGLSPDARAEKPTQLDWLAIYCVAVLDAEMAAAREPKTPCNVGIEACEAFDRAARQRLQDTRYRRERFFSYVLLRAPESDLQRAPTIRDRGAADAVSCRQQKIQAWPDRFKGCQDVCGGAFNSECLSCYQRGEPAVCQSV